MTPLTGDQVREQRLEREAREAKDALERASQMKSQSGAAMVLLGLAILAVGLFLLIIDPSVGELGERGVVSVHRLFLGQTASLIGAILFAAGVQIRSS